MPEGNYLDSNYIVHGRKKLSTILDKNNKEINDTGWIDLNEYVKYRKKNGNVYVTGNVSGDLPLGTDENYISLGTLPEGFRPGNIDIPFAYHCVGGDNSYQSSYIRSSGNIALYRKSSQGVANYYSFSVSFPV